MRASRTLALSLAREILQYGVVGFAAVSLVMISQNLLRRLDELTSVGFTLSDLGVVLACLFPMLTVYTIPIALLFGTALALRRRVTDSEILAMRACGLGLRTLLIPTVVIGTVVSAASAYLLLAVEHESRRDLIALFNAVAARGSILQAGDFRGIDDRVIYVASRDRQNRLEGIMISDRTRKPPLLIFAEEGRLALDQGSARIRLELQRGEMHLTSDEVDPERYRRVLFEEFDYSIDVSELLSGETEPVRPKQMTLAELRDVARRGRAGESLEGLRKQEPILYELEIHRRFALPLAPLLFAVAAVPIALVGRRGSRAWGPIACVTLAFAYYAFLMLLQFLARADWIAPSLAFWIPNAVLLAVAMVMLRRTGLGVSR